MADWKRSFILFLLLALLTGCSGEPDTGAKSVKWDRDSCERCRMVLSDRAHSAQVRYFPKGKQGSVALLFDDIGCAMIWLNDKPFKSDPRTEIWVSDHLTGEWINARTAYYVTGHMTPMEYGLGAQAEPAEGALDFLQARAHVFNAEKRFNAHGADLLKRLQELKERREQQNTPQLPGPGDGSS